MSNEISKTKINKFIELAESHLRGIQEAGKLLCEMLEEDATVIDQICAAWKGVTPDILRGFEKVGRGQWVPELTWMEKPVCAVLRKVPLELQEKYLRTPAELLITGGETLMVDSLNLTADQVKQVFEPDGTVRTLAAQRAWLEDKATKAVTPLTGRGPDIWVEGGKLIIRAPMKLTLKQVLSFLPQLEK